MGIKNDRFWTVIITLVLILSMGFAANSRNNADALSSYTKTERVETKKDTKEKEEDFKTEMKIITDNELQFSLEVPSDWEEVAKDGYRTFIHRPSASSVQIRTEKYDPAINNADAKALSVSIADSGKTFVGFTKTEPTHYELLYQDYAVSTYDYMEQVYWDRSDIIRLIFVSRDEHYERLSPYFEKILASFAWDKKDPVPEGYRLSYSPFGNFEAAVPSAWTFAATESTMAATDPETGASMDISFTEDDTSLDNLGAQEMAHFLSNGKNDFVMVNYEKSEDRISSTSTYLAGDVRFVNSHYVFSDGKNLYFISFHYKDGTLDESVPETCAGLFREFHQEEIH